MAGMRTLGCAIWDFSAPKWSDEATHRPGSTQNTDRSIGSDFGGTMRSTPITRSCLPPVTTSPASKSSGRSELLISTRRLTSAPDCRGIRVPGRTKPCSEPASVTTTVPDRNPSSSVSNGAVAYSGAADDGKDAEVSFCYRRQDVEFLVGGGGAGRGKCRAEQHKSKLRQDAAIHG